MTEKVICPKKKICDVDRDWIPDKAHCSPHKHNRNCDDEIGCWLKDSKCIPSLSAEQEGK